MKFKNLIKFFEYRLKLIKKIHNVLLYFIKTSQFYTSNFFLFQSFTNFIESGDIICLLLNYLTLVFKINF